MVTQELLIDKNGRPYNLNFQRPEGVPENATMFVNLKVEGTGHNIVSPGTFELTARELVIDENSEALFVPLMFRCLMTITRTSSLLRLRQQRRQASTIWQVRS